MRRRSLAFRLLVANLMVVAVGALALFATARLLGPQLFRHEVQQIGQRAGWGGGQGQGGEGRGAAVIEEELDAAFTGSLTAALGVALAAGVAASAVAAVFVSRRLLRPVSRMGDAVRSMAEGHYDRRVPEPRETELALLAADVNELSATLEATEDRRARLVSDLSHELRTPITALDGFLEGLSDGVFTADAATIEAMRSETRRMQRLARDLGALSRSAEEAFDLDREPADLGVIASAAARAVRAAATTRDVEVAVADLPPMPVDVDVDRMGQVFTNLLANAVRHAAAGGRVDVTGSAAGGVAAVTVTDDGDGITPEDLPRVFDRFYRGAGHEPAGGAGIGLTIARGLARAHGGDVTAASDGAGRGASFTVTVPLRT